MKIPKRLVLVAVVVVVLVYTFVFAPFVHSFTWVDVGNFGGDSKVDGSKAFSITNSWPHRFQVVYTADFEPGCVSPCIAFFHLDILKDGEVIQSIASYLPLEGEVGGTVDVWYWGGELFLRVESLQVIWAANVKQVGYRIPFTFITMKLPRWSPYDISQEDSWELILPRFHLHILYEPDNRP